MDSRDIGHVPPSNPANWWLLALGERRALDAHGDMWLSLEACEPENGRALVKFGYRGTVLIDTLNLCKPCNALRHPETGAPMLTFILRRVELSRAGIQITAPAAAIVEGPPASPLAH